MEDEPVLEKPLPAPPCYAALYPALVAAAKAHGYALAVHGSMMRDFDLIAVPWTWEASEPFPLIEALKAACEGVYHHHRMDHLLRNAGMPTIKPHGRVAYSIHLTDRGGEGPYLDVSVMSRQPCPHKDAAGKTTLRVVGGFIYENLKCDLCGEEMNELDL